MTPKDEPIVSISKDKGLHKLIRPIYWVGLAVVIVLIVGGFLLDHYVISSKPKTVTTISDVCALPGNKHLLESLSPYIQTGSLSEAQQPLISKIKSLKNYQHDPNCLYPLISYYLDISDPVNSPLYLKDLKTVYKPTFSYDSALGQTLSLQQLQDDVTELTNNSKAISNNSLSSPIPASVIKEDKIAQ